ncbi:MAG: D-aminoacyl-tRNA deacylase, partial [Oceanospirillum sp.]|nr:D-aminoacyl-tRNA deacylase [Oceanospirillum sp.]
MRALIQRVARAKVEVDQQCIGEIDKGLLVFIGVEKGDRAEDADRLLKKLLAYRVFADADEKMNLSVTDVEGGLLLVSQFTLAANTQKGLRPSFSSAAPPAEGEELYNYFVEQ